MKSKKVNEPSDPTMRMEVDNKNWCVGEVQLKYEEFKIPEIKVMSPCEAANVVLHSIDPDELKIQEHIYALYLDRSRRVLGFRTINTGQLSSVNINTRLFISIALLLNASSAIIFHNHPSGNMSPSSSDIDFTKNLMKAINQFDIELSDHIILSRNDYCSLRYDNYLNFEDVKYDYSETLHRKINDNWGPARRIPKMRKDVSNIPVTCLSDKNQQKIRGLKVAEAINSKLKIDFDNSNMLTKSDNEKGLQIFYSKMLSFMEDTEKLCSKIEKSLKDQIREQKTEDPLLSEVSNLRFEAKIETIALNGIKNGILDFDYYEHTTPNNSKHRNVTCL